MGRPIYLDYNATAPLRPQAAAAVADALRVTGNASSVHGFGRAARRVLEDARDAVAGLVGARPAELVFTSGGTEANALALALTGSGRHRVLVSAGEHPSVLQAVPDAELIPLDGDGLLRLDALEAMLVRDGEPALVSVMLANNETGVIQPVAQVAALAKRHGALFHCDAVQAVGKLPLDWPALGADLLSLSAHKLGGPQGVGALIVADRVDLQPLLRGGGQERRRRAGTENLPGIAGFGAAARAARDALESFQGLAAWRDALEARLHEIAPECEIFGRAVARLANTSCIAMPGVAAETQVVALDLEGLAVSAGSACSSGKVEPSHVLRAMGAGEAAGRAIRVSLGWASEAADLDRFVDVWAGLYRRLAARSSAA